MSSSSFSFMSVDKFEMKWHWLIILFYGHFYELKGRKELVLTSYVTFKILLSAFHLDVSQIFNIAT